MAQPLVEDTLARAEELVNREPSMAITAIQELSFEALSPDDRVRAHWVVGNAHRVQGRLGDARSSLEAALAIRDGVDQARRHEAMVSLAAVLISQGETRRAEQLLEATLSRADDRQTKGRGLMQLAMLRHRSGRLDIAREMYDEAIAHAAAAGDQLGEMRARNNWGLLELYVGDLDAAETQFEQALLLAGAIEQVVPQGVMRHNLGFVASRRGETRVALEFYEQARVVFVESDSTGYLGPLMIDTARNLSSLGLVNEARQAADEAVGLLDTSPSDRAEALLYAARARRDAGDLDGSVEAAREARRLFVEQGRPGWVPLADFAILLAQLDLAAAPDDARVISTIEALEEQGWRDEAGFARVTAALTLVRAGRLKRASELLVPVADVPEDGPAAERAVAITASAFLAAAIGQTSRAKRLVTVGLRELAQLEQTLGALELRAYARAHVADLAQLGVELASEHGGPRELLVRLEAQRARPSVSPARRPETEPDVDSLLTDLRTVVSARRSDQLAPQDLDALRRREHSIEAQIRRLTRRAEPGSAHVEPALAHGIDALDKRVAIMYGTAGDEFVAVTVVNGRCRRWRPSIDDVTLRDLTDGVDFALHRLNRRPKTTASRELAAATLLELGRELDVALLPASVRRSLAPIVLFPFDRLYGVAWSALPGLQGRAVTVAPSMSVWEHAARARTDLSPRRVLAVAGPGLAHAAREVDVVVPIHATGLALSGGEATTARCLAELEDVDIAHFACHGSFRDDNPLFSALRLADGDLTVYDLQRCARLPHTVVLSACGVGQSAVLRGGALLGMASALMQLGVASVIAPLTPVSDESSVELMTRLHSLLASGKDPAEALAVAGAASGAAVAAPFICFGY